VRDPNFWTVAASTRVNNLDQRLRNGSATAGMGFLPGPNSYFMRFLENHDEDRIAYLFGQGVDSTTARLRTLPVATAVNLAVGNAMVYAGQEVGRGYGIADFDQRRRGVISWNTSFAPALMLHYQKLAQIKKQFPAFHTQQMVRVNTDNGGVYAYTRPLAGQNGIVVANLEGIPRTVSVTLTASGNPPSVLGVTNGVVYQASNLYAATTTPLTFSSGTANLSADLPAYGSAVFVIDTVQRTVFLPPLTGVDETTASVPQEIRLDQNYPNPFNPATSIKFHMHKPSLVTLRVYDILGREVATLVDSDVPTGSYSIEWDGRNANGNQVSSGVYFYRLAVDRAGVVLTRKMVLLR
jgi:hypothetical protein